MFKIDHLVYKNILNIPSLELTEPLICLYGPSGSGKTTLLHLLNKLLVPDQGVIYYKGKNIASCDSVLLRRKVAMLGQTPIIYPGTVEENAVIGLKFSQKPIPSSDKVRIALNQAGFPKGLSDRCDTLSGGEKQRLCLARMLLLDAETYLLDEPSAALDKEMEYFVIQNMTQYCKENKKQLIVVTHSEHIVTDFSPKLVQLEKRKEEETP